MKTTLGTGVGVTAQIPGAKLDFSANGPQMSTTTDLTGNTVFEGNLGAAKVELSSGPLKLKAGASAVNVETKDGQIEVDPLKSGVGADLEFSKGIKQEEISAKGASSILDGTLSLGAHLGYVGLQVSVNVIKGGEAVVNFFGTIIEWGRSLAKEKTKNFGGRHDFIPENK